MYHTRVLALLLCTVAVAQCSIYFIDPDNGNDNNAGTSTTTAWKTLPGDQAVNPSSVPGTTTLVPGDKLYLKRGSIYFGSWNPKWDGTATNRIFIGSAPDEVDFGPVGQKAIMDGSAPISGWTPVTQSDAPNNPNWSNLVKLTLPQNYTVDQFLFCPSGTVYASQARPTADPFDFEVLEESAFESNATFRTDWNFVSGNSTAGGVLRLTDDRIASLCPTTTINAWLGIRLSGNIWRRFLIINDLVENGRRYVYVNWPPITNPPYSIASTFLRWSISHYVKFINAPGQFGVMPDGRTLVAWFQCPLSDVKITSLGYGIGLASRDYIDVSRLILRRYGLFGTRSGAAIIAWLNGAPSSFVTIDQCEATEISGGGSGAIDITGSANWTVTDFKAYSCPGTSGIRARTSTGFVLDGLLVRQVGRTALYLGGTVDFSIANVDAKDIRAVHGNGFTTYLSTARGTVSNLQVLNSDRPYTTQTDGTVTLKAIHYRDSVLIGPGGDWVARMDNGESNSTYTRMIFAPSTGFYIGYQPANPNTGLVFENCVIYSVNPDFDGTASNPIFEMPTFKNSIILVPSPVIKASNLPPGLTLVSNITVASDWDGTQWPEEFIRTLGPGPIGVDWCVPNLDGTKPASCVDRTAVPYGIPNVPSTPSTMSPPSSNPSMQSSPVNQTPSASLASSALILSHCVSAIFAVALLALCL